MRSIPTPAAAGTRRPARRRCVRPVQAERRRGSTPAPLSTRVGTTPRRRARVGSLVRQRVQHARAAVAAREVVRLRRAGVEDAQAVVAVAHHELRVFGEPVRIREVLARHGEPPRAVPQQTEPRQPRALARRAALLPAGRRDQGAARFGECVEPAGHVAIRWGSVHVQDGVEALEARGLVDAACLDDAGEAALAREQVEHLEREECVGAGIVGDHPQLPDGVVARPGTVRLEEGEALRERGPGGARGRRVRGQGHAQSLVERHQPAPAVDRGVRDGLRIGRGRDRLSDLGRLEGQPQRLRLHERSGQPNVPGVGVQPRRTGGAGLGVDVTRRRDSESGPGRSERTHEVRRRPVGEPLVAKAEHGRIRRRVGRSGGDRVQASVARGLERAPRVGLLPAPADQREPALPRRGEERDEAALVLAVPLGAFRPRHDQAAHRRARDPIEQRRLGPLAQGLDVARRDARHGLDALDLEQSARPADRNPGGRVHVASAADDATSPRCSITPRPAAPPGEDAHGQARGVPSGGRRIRGCGPPGAARRSRRGSGCAGRARPAVAQDHRRARDRHGARGAAARRGQGHDRPGRALRVRLRDVHAARRPRGARGRPLPEAVPAGQARRPHRRHVAGAVQQLVLAQRPRPQQRDQRRGPGALGHQGPPGRTCRSTSCSAARRARRPTATATRAAPRSPRWSTAPAGSSRRGSVTFGSRSACPAWPATARGAARTRRSRRCTTGRCSSPRSTSRRALEALRGGAQGAGRRGRAAARRARAHLADAGAAVLQGRREASGSSSSRIRCRRRTSAGSA